MASIVLPLLLLAGCVTPTAAEPKPDLRTEVEQFLEQRVELLDQGNVQGFLESASPTAQETERPIAIGAVAVPLTDLSMRPHRRAIRLRGGIVDNVPVDFVYRYEGLPLDNTFRINLLYDFAKTDGEWMVTAVEVSPGAALPVWASGPIQSKQSEHFLALYRPGLPDPDRILREAEQARAQLDGKITFPLENRYVLLLARDDEEYRAMSSATLGPVSAIAQVETSYEVTPQRIRVLSRQMVINSRKLHQDGTALETLRHELGHLAVAQYTRPFTPAWVSESAAMFLAGTRPTSIWRAGLRLNRFQGVSIERLTRAANLGEHDSSREGASYEYAYSAAAAWYLVATFGPERYWDFYRSYAQVPAGDLYNRLPESPWHPDGERAIEDLAVSSTSAALRQLFALDQAGLDRAVREWMAAQVA